MRKVFSLLAMVAVVLGMAGCGQNDPKRPEQSVITTDTDNCPHYEVVLTTDGGTLKIQISPADKEAYYYSTFCEVEAIPQMTRTFLQDLLESMFSSDVNYKYPEGLSQGDDECYPFVDAGKRYVLMIFQVDEGYKMSGDVEYMYFDSPE